MQNTRTPPSIVEYYAEHERYKCGYCKIPDKCYSHGMWAHAMTVSDYQDLIDRGWRRSGKYCYKPTMSVTCCPSYTIRCQALEFKASKSQKKIMKRVNKFLIGETQSPEIDGDTKMTKSLSSGQVSENLEEGNEQFIEVNRLPQNINIQNIALSSEESTSIVQEDDGVKGGTSLKRSTSDSVPGTSNTLPLQKDIHMDVNKAPCKKAKLLRRERRLEKLKEKGVDISALTNTNKNMEKNIEDIIKDLPENVKHKLEIKLVRTTPPSPEWLATSKQTHEVYVKYQTTIHGDSLAKCSEPKFREFLVQSPLMEEYSEVGPASGYGSFHQQYWLDDKIIAVGVIDILPKCVSSVYFFYDPEYMHLTLGTYGALREIAFTRQLHSMCPNLKYYYLGFYIHSCCKMRYKGNFHPSDLLCPETYKWFPIKNCLPKLDISPYLRLNPDVDDIDEDYPKHGDVNYIPILHKGSVSSFIIYRKKVGKTKANEEALKEYLQLVGSKIAKKLVLVQ